MQKGIVRAYFNESIKNSAACEIFCLRNVPVACMTYTSVNTNNAPIVDAFHFDRDLILLFDVGRTMRTKLYRRYRHVNVDRAVNRGFFLNA